MKKPKVTDNSQAYLISASAVALMLSVSTSSLILRHISPLNCSRKASFCLKSNKNERRVGNLNTSIVLNHECRGSFTHLASSFLRFSSSILSFSALISDVDSSLSSWCKTSLTTVSSSMSLALQDTCEQIHYEKKKNKFVVWQKETLA